MDEEQSNLTTTSKRSWVWNHFTFDEKIQKKHNVIIVKFLL